MKEFDITKHDLVPKHEILNDQQREELLKKYGINLRQLPRVLVTDPVVKIVQAKVGDVIRIVRKSETAGETEYYRVVTKA